jgi:hypothetical protein
MSEQTRDLTDFLVNYYPADLERLRAGWPGATEQHLFREREVLKGLEPLLAAKLDLAYAALGSFVELHNEVERLLSDQLDRANRWQFSGLLLGTLGSASSLSLLLFSPDQATLAKASAAAALLGNLVGIACKYLLSDIYGTTGGLREAHRRLAAGAGQALKIRRTIEPHLQVSDDGGKRADLERLVGQANSLIADMDEIVSRLPTAMRPRAAVLQAMSVLSS